MGFLEALQGSFQDYLKGSYESFHIRVTVRVTMNICGVHGFGV